MNKEISKVEKRDSDTLATPEDMLSYEEVQKYAHKNNIKSMREWFGFHNVRKGGTPRPRNIPGDPSKYFGRRDQWVSWPSFLGTATKATQILKDEFCDFEECKKWFADNKVYTVTQFREISKSGERPDFIPSAPDKKYEVKFSELLCPKKSIYLPFEDAKELVRGYGFKSYLEFREGRRNNLDKLAVVPCNPDKFYDQSNEWTSWPDFLGYSRLRK
ncbi:TPA: hypothetical protein ACVU4L_002036 [Vibrio parahaemolyticus]|uniref:hypothetical protein n=1 Tax=Vibrio sp. 1159 TaxID=3074545 RepID=UPI00296433EE|nr:hypothetical protein [Vibrio sp. 1159]MDW2320158.1 hypothetical protein [Vibrio sp. 1159]